MVGIGKCKEKEIKMSDDAKPWDLLNPNKERSPEELMEARLEICKVCEFYKAKTNRCGKCNCFMKLKTTLKDARCPVGKW